MSHHRPSWAVLTGLLVLAASACGGGTATPADAGAAGARSVTHAMGTTEIIGNPERVVVLDTGELDSVLALGVTPVGAVTADATGAFQSYLGDRTKGIEVVGTINEPNLEKIAALQPDLILSSKTRHEEIYAPAQPHRAHGVRRAGWRRMAGELPPGRYGARHAGCGRPDPRRVQVKGGGDRRPVRRSGKGVGEHGPVLG